MSSGVAAAFALVVPLRDHLAVAQHHGTDGDVVVQHGGGGLVEGEAHGGVEIHGPRRYRPAGAHRGNGGGYQEAGQRRRSRRYAGVRWTWSSLSSGRWKYGVPGP